MGKYIRIKQGLHPGFISQYHLGKKVYNPTNGVDRKTHDHVRFVLFESFALLNLLKIVLPQLEAVKHLNPKPVIDYFAERPTLNPKDVYDSSNGKAFWEKPDLSLRKLQVRIVREEKFQTYRMYLGNKVPKDKANLYGNWGGPVLYVAENELQTLHDFLVAKNREQCLLPTKPLYQYYCNDEPAYKRMCLEDDE